MCYPTLLPSWIAENKSRIRDQRIRKKEDALFITEEKHNQESIHVYNDAIIFHKAGHKQIRGKRMIMISTRKIILLLQKTC